MNPGTFVGECHFIFQENEAKDFMYRSENRTQNKQK